MNDKNIQDCWKIDNIVDLFNDVSFVKAENIDSHLKHLNNIGNKQSSIEESDDNTDNEKKPRKKQLYVGVMRKCDIEDHLRSFIGANFCFYHNFKISKAFIRYPKTLKLYYALKNEVDFIQHSEIKYNKSYGKFTVKMRFGEKKFFSSIEKLVKYCNNEVGNICC